MLMTNEDDFFYQYLDSEPQQRMYILPQTSFNNDNITSNGLYLSNHNYRETTNKIESENYKRKQKLFRLCRKNSIDEFFIPKLLTKSFILTNLNWKNIDGVTPLMTVCSNKSVTSQILGQLESNSVNFYLKDNHERNCFFYLLQNPKINYDLLSFFGTLFRESFFNDPDRNFKTPLMYLCENKSLNAILLRYFLNVQQVDLSLQDSKERTAFHYLCANSSISLELIQILVKTQEYDALQIQDSQGYTGFHYLIRNPSVSKEIINWILEKNCNNNQLTTNNQTHNKSNVINLSLPILDFIFCGSSISSSNFQTIIKYLITHNSYSFHNLFIKIFSSPSFNQSLLWYFVTIDKFEEKFDQNLIKYFETCFSNPYITDEVVLFLFYNYVKVKKDEDLNWQLFKLCLEKCRTICTIFLPYDFDLTVFEETRISVDTDANGVYNAKPRSWENEIFSFENFNSRENILKSILVICSIRQPEVSLQFVKKIINEYQCSQFFISKYNLEYETIFSCTFLQFVCMGKPNLDLLKLYFDQNPGLIKKSELNPGCTSNQWGEYLLIILYLKIFKILSKKKLIKSRSIGDCNKNSSEKSNLLDLTTCKSQFFKYQAFEKIMELLSEKPKKFKRKMKKNLQLLKTNNYYKNKIKKIFDVMIFLMDNGARLREEFQVGLRHSLFFKLFDIINSFETDFQNFYQVSIQQQKNQYHYYLHKKLIELRTNKNFEEVNIPLVSYNQKQIRIFINWVYGDVDSTQLILCKDLFQQLNIYEPERLTLKKTFKHLYKEQKSKDFTYQLKDDQSIKIHKILLFTRAPQLLLMSREINTDKLKSLTDYLQFDKKVWKFFFKFLYTNKYDTKSITLQNIEQIIDIFSFFLLDQETQLKYLKYYY
ncbi:ankyrin repeat-containing protein [Anaeramoeba flamelloides]|uniref:Ankyrin repeat-containing protein n=1 Tax=Anaeramoeba flamelloides TaxID=1746091 RepID=A0ABQ8YUC8_9EUKA|nr:ankyrin repeat-containing protein [Anaeramoeba flamelloides]